MSETRTLTGLGCQLGSGLRHYSVTSPETLLHAGNLYGWSPEPPEYGRCWVEVEAHDARDAKRLALRTKDFEVWVDRQRGDDVNPFTGLIAERFECEHGTCIACVEDPTVGCDVCAAEWPP